MKNQTTFELGNLLDHPIYKKLYNLNFKETKIEQVNFYTKTDLHKTFWGACEILIKGKWHATTREKILNLFKNNHANQN